MVLHAAGGLSEMDVTLQHRITFLVWAHLSATLGTEIALRVVDPKPCHGHDVLAGAASRPAPRTCLSFGEHHRRWCPDGRIVTGAEGACTNRCRG